VLGHCVGTGVIPPSGTGATVAVGVPALAPGTNLQSFTGGNHLDQITTSTFTDAQVAVGNGVSGSGVGFQLDFLQPTGGGTQSVVFAVTLLSGAVSCPNLKNIHFTLWDNVANPTSSFDDQTMNCGNGGVNTFGGGATFTVTLDYSANGDGFYFLSIDNSNIVGAPALQIKWEFCGQDAAEAAVYGDPHFTGFRGQQFDFHGQGGSTYHLYSDDEIMVNAKFSAWNTVGVVGSTFISGVGVRMRDLKVEYSMAPLTVDESEWAANVTDQLRELPQVELLIASRRVSLKRGHRLELGNCSSASFDGVLLRVQYGEYSIRVWHHISLGVPFLNVEMGIRRERMTKDNGGLLGLTTRTKDVDVNEAHHLVRTGGLMGTSAHSARFHLRPASYLDSSDCPLPSFDAASVSTRQPGVGAADGLSA